MADVESVRLAVAAQPSVVGSVACLVTGLAATLGNALQKGDVAAVQALADSLDAEGGKGWAEAVVANTPSAALTAEPFVSLPASVIEAFRNHAAKAAPAAHPAAATHR